jgi:hypothetical protein
MEGREDVSASDLIYPGGALTILRSPEDSMTHSPVFFVVRGTKIAWAQSATGFKMTAYL